MDYPESRYYKINRFLLRIAGQWHSQSTQSRIIIRTFFVVIVTTGFFVQAAKLVVEKFGAPYVIDIVPSAAIVAMCLFHFPYAYANTIKNKEIFDRMKRDWEKTRGEEETAIKIKYAKLARWITLYSSIYVSAGILFVMISGVYPQILDVINPLNESRLRRHPFQYEAFIDQQEYFYSLLLYGYVVVIVLMIIALANETLAVVFVQHARGMFSVIGYTVENLATPRGTSAKNKQLYEKAVIAKLENCITDHREALEFAALIIESTKMPALLLLTGSVVSLTVSLVAIIHPHLMTSKTVPLTIGHLIQLFIICYTGQTLTDASLKLSENAYNGRWYEYPVQAQKLLLLMTLRSRRPCSLTASDLYVLSLENYSSVTQTAMSYCMVFRE